MSKITALALFNLVAPPLCACGEKLEDDFEIRNGLCYFCQADAAMQPEPEEPVTAPIELIEMFNRRSRHFHGRVAS